MDTSDRTGFLVLSRGLTRGKIPRRCGDNPIAIGRIGHAAIARRRRMMRPPATIAPSKNRFPFTAEPLVLEASQIRLRSSQPPGGKGPAPLGRVEHVGEVCAICNQPQHINNAVARKSPATPSRGWVQRQRLNAHCRAKRVCEWSGRFQKRTWRNRGTPLCGA